MGCRPEPTRIRGVHPRFPQKRIQNDTGLVRQRNKPQGDRTPRAVGRDGDAGGREPPDSVAERVAVRVPRRSAGPVVPRFLRVPLRRSGPRPSGPSREARAGPPRRGLSRFSSSTHAGG